MTADDLLQISGWAVRRARILVPISANRHGNALNGPTHEINAYKTHRVLQLLAMRSRKSTLGREEVKGMKLDLSSEDERPGFATRSFQTADGSAKTMHDLVGHFDTALGLPQHSHFQKMQHADGSGLLPLEGAESAAKRAMEWRIGNCHEMSALAFMFLLEYPAGGIQQQGLPAIDAPVLIERLSIPAPGDHAFVVLGRSTSSSSTNPADWGDKAVVCDPWSNEAYKVSVANQQHQQGVQIAETYPNILNHHPSILTLTIGQLGGGHSSRWTNANGTRAWWKGRSGTFFTDMAPQNPGPEALPPEPDGGMQLIPDDNMQIE